MEENKKTKLLKYMSIIFIVEFLFFVIIFIGGVIASWNDGINSLGDAILVGFAYYALLFLIPTFISGICGLLYCFRKKRGKLIACWIFGIISILVNLEFINLWDKEIDLGMYKIHLFLIFDVFNILYLIGCYKAKLKK